MTKLPSNGYVESLFREPVTVCGKRAGDAYTNVRLARGGEAICTTIYSSKLDPDLSGKGYRYYDNREAVAIRIALMWNACRHLSNDQLTALTKPEARLHFAEQAAE